MIRKRKLYSRPRKAYVASRIKEENAIAEKYALKNKREIWKTQAKVNYFRRRAKELAKSTHQDQEVLFSKLKALGLQTSSIADVLGLRVESLLERRLPTIVFKKGLATTVKQARQMVVHKRVFIDGKAVNVPGYLVLLSEESQITAKKLPVQEKKAEPIAEEA